MILENTALKEIRQINVGHKDGVCTQLHVRQLFVDRFHVIQIGQILGVACVNDVYNSLPFWSKKSVTKTELLVRKKQNEACNETIPA